MPAESPATEAPATQAAAAQQIPPTAKQAVTTTEATPAGPATGKAVPLKPTTVATEHVNRDTAMQKVEKDAAMKEIANTARIEKQRRDAHETKTWDQWFWDMTFRDRYVIVSISTCLIWFILALLVWYFRWDYFMNVGGLKGIYNESRADVAAYQVNVELEEGSLFSCDQDSTTCVFSFCCPALVWAQTRYLFRQSICCQSTPLGIGSDLIVFTLCALVNGVLFCGFAYFGVFTALLMCYCRRELRSRKQFNSRSVKKEQTMAGKIQSVVGDFLAVCFCPCCAIAQENRAAKRHARSQMTDPLGRRHEAPAPVRVTSPVVSSNLEPHYLAGGIREIVAEEGNRHVFHSAHSAYPPGPARGTSPPSSGQLHPGMGPPPIGAVVKSQQPFQPYHNMHNPQ